MSFLIPRWRHCIPKRYIFVIIAHIACFMIYAQRFNFSVSLVSMVKKTGSNIPTNRTSTRSRNQHRFNTSKSAVSFKGDEGEFAWSEEEQGLLKSAFFHGYTCTLLFGGFLSSKWSGKYLFGIGILAESIATLLIPVAARSSYSLIYIMRFFIGFCQGLSNPSIQAVLKEWAPMDEKTRLSAIVYSGSETGSVGSLVLGGVICSYFGWPALSYVLGVAGIVLFITWMTFVSDSPLDHPTISTEEQQYILKSQYDTKRLSKDGANAGVPWYNILTSGPVMAISIAKMCHNWIYYLAIDDIPSYFKDVLNMRVLKNGFSAGVPFVFSFFTQIISSVATDHCIKKGCSVTITRKVVTSLGFTLAAILFCLVGYIGSESQGLSVACVVLLVGVGNISYGGFGVNQLDISSRFAGVIWSINSFVGNFSGVACSLVTGYVTNNHPTQFYYRIVFMIAAGVSMFGVVFYCAFGSGVEQEWNKISEEEEDEEDEKDEEEEERKENDSELSTDEDAPLLRSP